MRNKWSIRINRSFEGHALVCVPFSWGLGKVERSGEGQVSILICFGASTTFCRPSLAYTQS